MPNCDDNSAKYTECYVAFLDILGFKEWVKRSIKDRDVLSILIKGLTSASSLGPTSHSKRKLTYKNGNCVGSSNEREWVTQIRAFSDCVVIFIPTETHALTDILRKVRYLHDRLLELDCCLRGAVTIGDMYWNDAWSRPKTKTSENSTETPGASTESTPNETPQVLYDRNIPENDFITLGPALVEAYELESTVAIYPRVIFSPKLMAHIEKMKTQTPENAAEGIHKAVHAVSLCSPSPENHGRCILDFIRRDGDDGVPFLDLFNQDIVRNDTERIVSEPQPDGRLRVRWEKDGMTYEQFMRKTWTAIDTFLNTAHAPKIRAKYLWLANYFNQSLAQHNIDALPLTWS